MLKRATPNPANARALAKGLSIIEMMIGLAIGLGVIAAATSVVSAQLVANSETLLVSRTQAALREAVNQITQNVSHAGFEWNSFFDGSAPTGRRLYRPEANKIAYRFDSVYDPILLDGVNTTGTGSSLVFYRSWDAQRLARVQAENGAIDAGDAQGFRLNTGVLEMMDLESNWVAVSDPKVIVFDTMQFRVNEMQSPVPCGFSCTVPGTCAPKMTRREVKVSISAHSPYNTAIVRKMESTVVLDNFIVRSGC